MSTVSCPGDEEECTGERSILGKRSLFQPGAFNIERFTSQLMIAAQSSKCNTSNMLEKSMELPEENIYHGGLVNYSFSSTSSDENLLRHLQVAKQFLAEPGIKQMVMKSH